MARIHTHKICSSHSAWTFTIPLISYLLALTKDKTVYQVRMSTLFPKHLHMKHSNVWRTVFYFLLMTHLCGDLGDKGPPGETIHKPCTTPSTLRMIVFHFPPLTYKGPQGVSGKNVHTISKTPPHKTLKCVKDCFLFSSYDPLVWWPRPHRSSRWDHSQAMHNTLNSVSDCFSLSSMDIQRTTGWHR